MPVVAQLVGKEYLKPSENWIYNQVRALRTVRSIFLAERRREPERFPWPEVYTVDALPPLARGVDRAARELLGYSPLHRRRCRRHAARLLHVHFGVNARRALPLARSLRIPMLASFYGRDMYHCPEGEGELRRRYRRLFAQASGFVAEGPAARDRLVDLGCPAERVHIHRLGVDLEKIPFVERIPAADGSLRVLMAARFTEKKGMRYGVEACCRVAREDPRLTLTVVGDAGPALAEQRIRQELHDRVAVAGVGDRVRFAGFLGNAELHDLARGHDLFLHPSVHAAQGDAEGGHPVVLTEMAASGMPILATRHCDIPQVVIDGRTGWLTREREVDELADALRQALGDRARLREYGRNGRALIEERYDLSRNTLDEIYAAYL